MFQAFMSIVGLCYTAKRSLLITTSSNLTYSVRNTGTLEQATQVLDSKKENLFQPSPTKWNIAGTRPKPHWNKLGRRQNQTTQSII